MSHAPKRVSDAGVASPWSADKVSGDFSRSTSVNGGPPSKWSQGATEDRTETDM